MDFDATESNEEVQPNRRESRNEDMRAGYDLLRSRIPCLPQDQNIPRIKTLSLAIAYIKHLANVLSPPEGTQPLETDDFASIVRDELQTRNNYSMQLEEQVGMGIPVDEVAREIPRRRGTRSRERNSPYAIPRIPTNMVGRVLNNIPATSAQSSQSQYLGEQQQQNTHRTEHFIREQVQNTLVEQNYNLRLHPVWEIEQPQVPFEQRLQNSISDQQMLFYEQNELFQHPSQMATSSRTIHNIITNPQQHNESTTMRTDYYHPQYQHG